MWGVHARARAWGCMGELHGVAWESTAGWPGAQLHACLGVHAWLLSAHAWCTRGGWVGNIAEVQGGSALHMHGVRSSAYMHGVTIL